MSRNRVIYQSEALFVSKDVESTGKRDHMQLRRIQSANYSFNVTRTDLNQFGQLSRIDSLILEAPSVSADISYYLGDGYNEEALNFANSNLNVGFVSGQIESTSGQNLYIATAPDGKDANFGTNTGFTTIGIGNAFVTDYSLEASVGGFPTVTVSFEGSNINASAGVSGSPDGFSGKITGAGIDPVSGTPLASQIYANANVTDPVTRIGTGIEIRPADPGTDAGVVSALRPSDIFFDLTSANGDTISDIDNTNGCHVQSVSLSIPLSRTPIERLGTRFPFARTVDFPITPTLSVSAILSEVEEKSLTTIVDSDDFIPSATITIKDGTADNNDAAIYKLTNLKLDSESFSSSVGPNKTVDLTFSVSVGGPDDTVNNIFFSGANTDEKFALKRIVLDGASLEPDETVKINGVSFSQADPGPKTVGYMHGQSERVFKVNYTGDANLNIGSIAGGTITGFLSADDRTSDVADGLTAASGAAGGFLEFKADIDLDGLYDNTGSNSEETITGTITQS